MSKQVFHIEYNAELMKALQQPFPPEAISWKPGATNANRQQNTPPTRAMFLPYVDPRWYQEALDRLVGGWGWSNEIEVTDATAQKMIVRITILGVTKEDAGEKEVNDPNTMTAAVAQGTKRACVQHGLGRYLYLFMQPRWEDCDRYGKPTEQAKLKLRQAAIEDTEAYLAYLDGKVEQKEVVRQPFEPDDLSEREPAGGRYPPAKREQPQEPASNVVPFVAPEPEPPAPTVGPPPPAGEIAELNFTVPDKTKSGQQSAASKHTGISGRPIKLRELVLVGEQGVKYIEWLSKKDGWPDGKKAALAVMEWLEAGNSVAPTEDPLGNPVAQPQEPQVAVNPPAPPLDTSGVDVSDYPSDVVNMMVLAEKFNTTPGDAWSILSKNGFSGVPKPNDIQAWQKAWGVMKAHQAAPGGQQAVPFVR